MFSSITKSTILFSKLNFVLKCVEKWLPLWKILKLVLEQNVTKQTYLKISCRSQKCLVQPLNQQFYLVNWILFSNVSNSILWKIINLEKNYDFQTEMFGMFSKKYFFGRAHISKDMTDGDKFNNGQVWCRTP